jgi:hypothetical protein
VPLRIQALRVPGFRALCATANSGAVRLRACGHRAPLIFGRCAPLRTLTLCVFAGSGAARPWVPGLMRHCEPGRYASLDIRCSALVRAGAHLRLREFGRSATLRFHVPCATEIYDGVCRPKWRDC